MCHLNSIKYDLNGGSHKLKPLKQFEIQRCLKPKDFGVIVNLSLHHFLDGAEEGYGHVSYVRYLNDKGDIHCQLILCFSSESSIRRSMAISTELHFERKQEIPCIRRKWITIFS